MLVQLLHWYILQMRNTFSMVFFTVTGFYCIGSGKSVWIYDSQTYKEIITFPALTSAAIHGIRFSELFSYAFHSR